MKKGKLPSQELKSDYDRLNKRAKRAYKREMRKNQKRLGTQEGKQP